MKPSLTSPLENKSIQEVSKIFKIISDPTRLSILFLLQKEELSVGTIAQSLSMEQSAISHQVKAKRAGKSMIYSLDDLHIFSILEQVLTHIKEPEE